MLTLRAEAANDTTDGELNKAVKIWLQTNGHIGAIGHINFVVSC
jgi:hypothetical protein